MNPIVFALPVFLLSIGLELWVARRRGRVVYDLPDAVMSLQLGVLSQVSGAFGRLATLGIYAAVSDRLAVFSWSMANPWLWALALLVYDFCFYWHHRMGHRVSVLWAAHVVHHSSEYFNLTTALRQSSSQFLLGWVFYLPMAVLGVPLKMFVVVALVDLLYQYWVHTELVGRLGWLDRVLVTPSNHRVHHGQNDHCLDVNYGGILIVWDRLFGSWQPEREGEKIIYGVRKPLHSLNPLWGNLHVYAQLWQQARQTRDWRQWLGVWLAPPGGRGPVAPLDLAHFERYAVHPSRPVQAWVVLNGLLLAGVFAHFLAVFNRLGAVPSAVYAAWLVVSVVSLGGWLEGRPWARRTEAARWLVVAMVGLAGVMGQLPQLPI